MIANKLGSVAQTTLLSQSVCGFSQATKETVIILHDLDHWVLAGFIGGVMFVGDSFISWLCTKGRKQNTMFIEV